MMSNQDTFTLTNEEFASNLGDLLHSTSFSPSLYEEIFDGKNLNELITDPLLSDTRTSENGNRMNGQSTSQNSVQIPISTTTTMNQQIVQPNLNLIQQNEKHSNENGQNNGNELDIWLRENLINQNGNGNGNGVNEIYNFNTYDHHYSGMDTQNPSISLQRQPISIHQPIIQNQSSIQQSTIQNQPIYTESSQQTVVQPQIPKGFQVATTNWQSTSTNPVYISRNISNSTPSVFKVKTEPQDQYPILSQTIRSRNLSSDSSIGDQQQNLSRGAAYAREYRLKNKRRVNQLEIDNERLHKENQQLREAYEEGQRKIMNLNREVVYLRQVLANDSSLATLINSVMTNAPGLKFQVPMISSTSDPETSQVGAKRKATSEHNLRSKERKSEGAVPDSNESPGICFHVDGDLVSVEFCPRCNRESKRGRGDQQ